MPDMTDILDAEAGEEPDAIRRALAEDMLEMSIAAAAPGW